jgi:hypothetical protein
LGIIEEESKRFYFLTQKVKYVKIKKRKRKQRAAKEKKVSDSRPQYAKRSSEARSLIP